jgi:hypothetical protein
VSAPGHVESLRARATSLRAQADLAAKEHVRIARSMLGAEGAEHTALELEAGVADCMSRRYQLWAARLDEAAYELENP